MAAIGTTVKFYNYTGDTRVISKTLTNESQNTTVYLSNNCNIAYPSISLPYNSTWLAYNYCYITDWNRYYYISEWSTDSAGKLYANLAIDVLKTYATDLLGCPVTVVRSQSVGMNHIVDDKYPLFPDLCNINVIELVPDKPLRKASGNNILLGVL